MVVSEDVVEVAAGQVVLEKLWKKEENEDQVIILIPNTFLIFHFNPKIISNDKGFGFYLDKNS